METIRLNITLPANIAEQLNRFSGPRKRSRFIAEAIQLKIKQIQKKETDDILAQGYKSSKIESLEMARTFESLDIEGWDDY